jgi:DNA invertase Pin-like site-specific DNA recombinase
MARKMQRVEGEAVGYVRVSTSKQELGPEVQRKQIAAYAARHGLRVVAWFHCGFRPT